MIEAAKAVIPVSVGTAEHYTWGAGCDGWHFLRHADVGVILERMPPSTSEVRHLHERARQFFFILSGIAVLEVDGVQFTLSSGEGVEVPPGKPHQVFNRSEVDAEFLVVSQPHSHGDRIVLGG